MVTTLVERDLGFRKIQQTGRESYIVSLPKQWVTDNGLNKGDQLAFRMQEDSSILLIPRNILENRGKSKEAPLNEFIVNLTGKENAQSVSRRIISLYEVGAELITIRFKKGENMSSQKIAIKKTTKMLLGTEIISELPDEIIIQILIGHPKFPIEKAIRRMLVIAKLMDREAVSVFRNYDEEVIQNVIESDDDLDRLNLYVVRQLKYGIKNNLFREMEFNSPREFLGYRIVAKNIENLGDNAVRLAKNILFLKGTIYDQSLTLTKQINEETCSRVFEFNTLGHLLLENSLKAMFKRDYQLADEVISRFMSSCFTLEKEAIELILKKGMDYNVALVLRLILDNSRKMMEYSRDIAEVTLNRTVEEANKS